MKKYYLFVLLALLSFFGEAQTSLLDSVSLFSTREFTDLNSALANKDSVYRLVLRKKKLKEFPVEIYQFKNLQYLDISKNSIKTIPDSLVKLTKLQYFKCSKNNIEELPRNFGHNENLRSIDLSQNEIKALPYSFGRLSKLEYADLWDNNLEEFPASMSDLKGLRMLDLRNILISKTKQEGLQNQLPKTYIYFSAPCNCGL